MRNLLSVVIFFLLMTFCNVGFGRVENTYPFTHPLQQQRFHHLIGELRCVVCQNQSLAESNAPLAQDLKKIVYEQIKAGFTDEQIKQYLVKRYGEYILFKPNLTHTTFVLWLGPFLFLIGALSIMYLSIRKHTRIAVEPELQGKN